MDALVKRLTTDREKLLQAVVGPSAKRLTSRVVRDYVPYVTRLSRP
jgi:hypothetical protein